MTITVTHEEGGVQLEIVLGDIHCARLAKAQLLRICHDGHTWGYLTTMPANVRTHVATLPQSERAKLTELEQGNPYGIFTALDRQFFLYVPPWTLAPHKVDRLRPFAASYSPQQGTLNIVGQLAKGGLDASICADVYMRPRPEGASKLLRGLWYHKAAKPIHKGRDKYCAD